MAAGVGSLGPVLAGGWVVGTITADAPAVDGGGIDAACLRHLTP